MMTDRETSVKHLEISLPVAANGSWAEFVVVQLSKAFVDCKYVFAAPLMGLNETLIHKLNGEVVIFSQYLIIH